MLHRLVHSLLACFLLLGLAGAATAQEVPFVGVVVQDDVPMRAGAGRAYYEVGRIGQGQTVQVDDVIFGWNKVVPPEGVVSFIEKGQVDVKGAGQSGVVNVDRADVKAGSPRGPGESYRVQTQLERGATVEILGEEGNFYRIRPPREAFVFLPPGSVRRQEPGDLERQPPAGEEPAQAPADAGSPQSTTAEQAPQQATPTPQPPEVPETPEAPEAAEAPTTERPTQSADSETSTQAPVPDAAETPDQPADDESAQAMQAAEAPETSQGPQAPQSPAPEALQTPQTPEASAAAQAQPAPDQGEQVTEQPEGADTAQTRPAPESPAVSDRLRTLENRLLPLMEQPLEDQPIDEMVREYEAIQRQELPAFDRQLVRVRLATLQRNRELAQTLRQIRDVQQGLTEVEPVREEQIVRARVDYDAVGRLMASSVYNGQALPRGGHHRDVGIRRGPAQPGSRGRRGGGARSAGPAGRAGWPGADAGSGAAHPLTGTTATPLLRTDTPRQPFDRGCRFSLGLCPACRIADPRNRCRMKKGAKTLHRAGQQVVWSNY